MATWPPSSGVTSKVVPREKVVVEITYSNTIRAPASDVFETILHISEYSKWNTWIPSARILTHPPPSAPDEVPDDFSHMRNGSVMVFNAIMDANKPDKSWATELKVVDISTPDAPTSYVPTELLQDPTFTSDLSKVYRVSWTGHGGLLSVGLNLERFHEVIIKGPDECELRNWEVMSGLIAYPVKWTQGTSLKGHVAQWCEDLKKYCEQKHSQGNSQT